MNAALQLAQLEYDNRLPVEQDDSEVTQWLENNVDQLMRGGDVTFKRRLCSPQGVKFTDFMVAVDEYALERMNAPFATNHALGTLVFGAITNCPTSTRQGVLSLICRADPKEDLRKIAEGLLRPLAADGVIAQREDEEL
ncbi:hypothetical protein ACTACG_07205 [Pseudomonas syringae]|uniref:hypothetical protein n=1 Tax=Pseudomonas syringae TaxID=317 RepID=UPI003F7553B9